MWVSVYKRHSGLTQFVTKETEKQQPKRELPKIKVLEALLKKKSSVEAVKFSWAFSLRSHTHTVVA
jgi:RNA-binding protein YhbY